MQANVPVVLGWALPVGNAAASQAAAVLYDKLATGLRLDMAIAAARQFLFEQNHPTGIYYAVLPMLPSCKR